MSKHAKKPVLKRSLLSYAVAVVAIGGFGQEAYADLCTLPANSVTTANPADNCLLDAVNETVSISLSGTIGLGISASATGVSVTNAGLVSNNWTAIEFSNVDLAGSVSNSGDIDANATSSGAIGINLDGDAMVASTGSINNTGTIIADVSNFWGAWASGISIDGNSTNTSSGDTNVGANTYDSTWVTTLVGVDEGGSIVNSGVISALAAGSPSGVSAHANGIYANGAMLGSIDNSGTINASGVTTWWGNSARGIQVDGGDINSGSFHSQTGPLFYSSSSNWDNAYIGVGAAGSIDNSGTINATASGGAWTSGSAYAAGIDIDGAVLGAVDNSGTINVSASDGNWALADGILIGGDDLEVGQSGQVVSATVSLAGTTGSTLTNYDTLTADVALDSSASLSNSGDILVSASVSDDSAYATGIDVQGIVRGSIVNSGNIGASASADSIAAAAIGLYIDGGDDTHYVGDSTVNYATYAVSTSGSTLTHYASTENYIGIDAGAVVTNSGTIEAAAEADWLIGATGVDVNGAVLGSVTNAVDGEIVAEAVGNWNGNAQAIGISLGGGDLNVYSGMTQSAHYSNTTAASAGSMSSGTYATNEQFVGVGAGAALTNSGSITAAANGGVWWTAGNVYATGMAIDGAVLGTVTNGGSITAGATNAYATYANGLTLGGGDLDVASGSWYSNNDVNVAIQIGGGTTTVDIGINTTNSSVWSTSNNFVALGAAAALTNSGAILAAASGPSTAEANGIEIDGAVLGSVTNSGSITADAESWWNNTTATGLSISGGDITANNGSSDDLYTYSMHFTGTASLSATVSASHTTSMTSTNWASQTVGLGAGAALTNSGTISVSADAGDWNANAYGVQVGGVVLGSLLNSNAITVSAEGRDGNAYALGLSVDNSNGSSGTSSTQSDATMDYTFTDDLAGTWAESTVTSYATSTAYDSTVSNIAVGAAGSITNDGSLSVAADASSTNATATALEVDGVILGSVTNSGDIVAAAQAYAYNASATAVQLNGELIGAYVGSSSVSGGSTVTSSATQLTTTTSLWTSGAATNTATVSTWSTNEATVALGAAAALTNTGTISAVADQGASWGSNATASGLNVDGAVLGTIDNSGMISAVATALGEDAYAYAANIGAGDINAYSGDYAYTGQYTDNSNGDNLGNSTHVTSWQSSTLSHYVTSESDVGVAATGAVTNSGTVQATAAARYNSAGASGLNVYGAMLGTFSNTGSITAQASTEYGDDAWAYALQFFGGNINSYSGTSTDWSGQGDLNETFTSAGAWASDYAETSRSMTSYVSDEADTAIGVGAVVTNSGTVAATADAGSDSVWVTGLYVSGANLGSIANTGTISATGSADDDNVNVWGLYQSGGSVDHYNGSYNYTYAGSGNWAGNADPLSNTGTWVSNTATSTTYATDESYVSVGAGAALTNSGSITADATVGDDDAYAAAVEMYGANLGTISNAAAGTIAAQAVAAGWGAQAYGLYLEGGDVDHYDGNGSSTYNYASETVAFVGEYTSNGTWQTAYNTAESYVSVGVGASLTNAGTISASATAGNLDNTSGGSATATGLYLDGAVRGAFDNTGTIAATAVAGYEYAYAVGFELNGGSIDTYSGSEQGNWMEDSNGIDSNHSNGTWVTDEKYVSLDVGASFTNSGTISAAAEAGSSSASATALYISGAVLGSLSNTGTLSATATAGYEYAYADGLHIDSGILYASAGSWADLSSNYDWTSKDVAVGGSLVNSGTISAVAEAGGYSAEARGVVVHGMVTGGLTNSGEITAVATAQYYATATGLVLGGGSSSAGNQDSSTWNSVNIAAGGAVTNSGTINAFAEASSSASALGIDAWGELNGTLDNSGTVRASANAGYDAYATGFNLDGDLNGTVTNSNAIAASADAEWSSAGATAVEVDGDLTGSFINSDSLGAYAGARFGAAWATGVGVWDDVSGTVGNSGTLDVAADGGTGWASAWGVYFGSMSGTGSLNNTGYIGVTAQSVDNEATAYGVQVDGSMHGSAVVNNASGAEIAIELNGSSNWAYGIDVGMMHDSAQVLNAGTVSVKSTDHGNFGSGAWIFGVHTAGLYETAQVINSGAIAIDQSGFGSAVVVGLDTGSVHDGSVVTNTSTGTIDVAAEGDVGNVSATGLSIGSAYDGATLTNDGKIDVTVTGGSYTDFFSGSYAAYVRAVGISLDSQMVDSTLTNNSAITVSGDADTEFDGYAAVYGIKGGLVDGASTINNTGTIDVAATGANNDAYGIYVRALTNGASVVNSGTIDVAGDNAWGIYVNGGIGGSVNNSGTIAQGVHLGGNVGLTNSGSITSAASHVGGNYTQALNGSLVFPAVTASNYGTLTVGGTADFTADNSVVVAVDPRDNLADGDVLTDVISAGTLTASAFDVTDNTLFWVFTPTIDGNTLDLTADYLGAEGVLNGTDFNLSSSLAGVIDGIIADGADGQYAALAAALNAAANGDAAAELLQGFLPTLNGGVARATRTSTSGMGGIIEARLSETSGAASGDAFKNGGVWLKAYTGSASQSDVDNVMGYDVDSNGFVLGVDGNVSDAWTAGLAVGSVSSEASDDLTDLAIKTTLFNLYGAYTINDRTTLDLNLGYGRSGYDSDRDTGAFGTATASYDGSQYSLGAKVSRTYKVATNRVFTPSVALNYVQIGVDSYSENGAGIMNQSVRGADETSTSVMLNGKYDWIFNKSGTLSANLGLGYDNADDARATTTLVNGPTYVVNGVENEPVVIGAGIGYRYVTVKGLEFTAAYDLESRSDFQAGNASLKFRMPF